MDDFISRKATIDAMEDTDWYHINKDGQLTHGANSDDYEPLYKAKDVYAVLNTMSSAHPERRWIPCSERMPKKNGFYLCTTKDCITILEFIEGNPHYHEEPSFVSDVLGKCNSYVVAWIPLPEPYNKVEKGT